MDAIKSSLTSMRLKSGQFTKLEASDTSEIYGDEGFQKYFRELNEEVTFGDVVMMCDRVYGREMCIFYETQSEVRAVILSYVEPEDHFLMKEDKLICNRS